MSTEQPHAPFVSRERCREWRDRAANGETYTAIAADGPWVFSTVAGHCNGDCGHERDDDRSRTPHTDDPDELIEIVQCLASEFGRSPTGPEVTQSDYPATKETYVRVFGSFRAGLDAADLPARAGENPEPVRELLYQRAVQDTPELAGQEAER